MQLSARGYLLQDSGCGGGCGGCGDSGVSSAAQPFDLAFRNGPESYQVIRSGEQVLNTQPGQYVPLALSGQVDLVRLVALKTSAPIKLRLNGAPAQLLTAALWPVANLSGLTLVLGLEGIAVSVIFQSADSTQADVIRRINAAAALAGLSYLPASLTALGQVRIAGQLTGAQSILSPPSGTSVIPLGLSNLVGAVGSGQDVDVDGLYVQQLPRALGAQAIQVSGQGTLSVLVAG